METLQRTANRGSISTVYDIDNSVKLEPDNAEYFQRPAAGSNGSLTTWTFSLWLKRTELSHNNIFYSQGGNGRVRFESNDTFSFRYKSGNELTTSRVFRDTSAWYHIVIAVDTTQATASNRVKIYFNGVQETMSGTQPALNATSDFGAFSTVTAQLGQFTEGAYYFAGYMAEFYWIDGIQQAPTDFGEFDSDTGIWKPKAYTGSFGSEGVYLDFESSGSLGADSSGNGNNFTENNITSVDQATDTPTNNFCTINPLVFQNVNGLYSFITEGATKARSTQFDVYYTYPPTFGVTSGKWYAEFEYEGSNVDNLVGILDIDAVVPFNSRLGKAGAWSVGLYQANGTLFVTSDSGVTTTASWGATAADGDIMSVAVDMDNYFVYIAKNGTWQNSGVPTSGATGTGGVAFDSNKTVGIGCSAYGFTSDGIIFTNYGGYTAGTISSAATDANGYGTFEYAPPSGYYALCGKNLAEFGGTA